MESAGGLPGGAPSDGAVLPDACHSLQGADLVGVADVVAGCRDDGCIADAVGMVLN